MPVQFLSEAEHKYLNHFPTEISSEDLNRFFLLSDKELTILKQLRAEHNRLGFALQLCCLRYLGFFPEKFQLPERVIDYVAQQLQLIPELLVFYGKRSSTQREHQRKIQALLGYRRASNSDLLSLEQWLIERALEHNQPLLLFHMACEHLKQQKILRIGTTILARMVATTRIKAQEINYQSLKNLLTTERSAWLDSLLKVEPDETRTPLSWLQRTPTGNNPKQILETLDKISFLQQNQVDTWDLSQLNPNRINHLAKIGARATNQYLQRASEVRRYPILVCFLKQSLYNFTDDLIEMVDRRLWELYNQAKRNFDSDRLMASKTIDEKLKTLQDIGQILLNQNIEDNSVRAKTFEYIAPDELKVSLSETKQLIRPENDAYVDYFGKSYNRVRRFSSKLLTILQFQARGNDSGLLTALNLVHEIHLGRRRKLPTDAPTDFIPEPWLPYVLEEQEINRRYYELAALWLLRQQLRSGDIYIPQSRRFSQLETYFIPQKEWSLYRDEVVNLTGTPIDAKLRLAERESELVTLMGQVEELLNQSDSDLREERGKLILSPIKADEKTLELKRLAQDITARLPRIEITDLLVEVDSWTNFSAAFEHLNLAQDKDHNSMLSLYSCLLAQACNLDFQQMAISTGLSYRSLCWFNNWYVRDETLRLANNILIDHHYDLPLSHLWGGGMLSSSDGQRFPAKGSLRQARSLPRYFGYGKGVTFYSWTSDQFSQYGSKPIPATVRDATYVLDEILNNETELSILEHTTDTAGYTEVIFALFDLLGMRFSPRIRDLADQKLYRTSNINLDVYPLLKEHIQGIVNQELIFDDWDEMLRLVGSLKMGWVTASLIIQKLQAFPRKHPLMRALQEYGRLIKTIHLLRWYADETNRRRLKRQLNKGEALHSLRSQLFYANQGELKTQQDDQLLNQVGCLNLVTNAIIVWNTVYIDQAVRQFRQESYSIDDEDLKYIWPTRHAHINVYGQYHFDRQRFGKSQPLRTLRNPGS
jgi:TnpA family transposase